MKAVKMPEASLERPEKISLDLISSQKSIFGPYSKATSSNPNASMCDVSRGRITGLLSDGFLSDVRRECQVTNFPPTFERFGSVQFTRGRIGSTYDDDEIQILLTLMKSKMHCRKTKSKTTLQLKLIPLLPKTLLSEDEQEAYLRTTPYFLSLIENLKKPKNNPKRNFVGRRWLIKRNIVKWIQKYAFQFDFVNSSQWLTH